MSLKTGKVRDKKGKQFEAKFMSKGEELYLGRYKTKVEAAEIVRKARKSIQTGTKLDEDWKRKHCTMPSLVKVYEP